MKKDIITERGNSLIICITLTNTLKIIYLTANFKYTFWKNFDPTLLWDKLTYNLLWKGLRFLRNDSLRYIINCKMICNWVCWSIFCVYFLWKSIYFLDEGRCFKTAVQDFFFSVGLITIVRWRCPKINCYTVKKCKQHLLIDIANFCIITR